MDFMETKDDISCHFNQLCDLKVVGVPNYYPLGKFTPLIQPLKTQWLQLNE